MNERTSRRPGSRSERSSRRGWRRLRGSSLALLGVLLTVSVISLVQRTRLENASGPNLDPGLSEEWSALAREALRGSGSIPTWRSVSEVESPWGRVTRLRPLVEGIEVRGADGVLHLPLLAAPAAGGREIGASGATVGDVNSDGWRLERDLAAVPWSALQEAARRYQDGGELSATIGLTRWRSAPRPFLLLRSQTSSRWSLGLEISIPAVAEGAGSDSKSNLLARLSTLPWNGAPPDVRGPMDLELILDPQTLEIVEARDLRHYQLDARAGALGGKGSSSRSANLGDVNGRALLFDPNPVAVSGRLDLRDGDPVELYRTWLPLLGLDDTGYLQGPRVEVRTNHSLRAQNRTGLHEYSSSDPRFEEAMAYYHGDRALTELDSLGFHGLFVRPLKLWVHATPLDNSWYSRPERTVFLGDGGVDDAEDADIILHELGHAIHDALVPGFGGGDTRALSEGFGDFWAAGLTGDACVGDWDATSYGPPCLRRADTRATYPASLTGRPHADGQIWSGLLWDIRQALGPTIAAQLSLAAFLEQGVGTTYPEAALGLLRAARRLGLEAEEQRIRELLAARGLGPREIEVELEPLGSFTVELLGNARFLDQEVGRLTLSGDGQMHFEPLNDPGSDQPLPESFPWAIPCGLSSSENPPGTRSMPAAYPPGRDGIHLRARLIEAEGKAEILLQWIQDEFNLARIQVQWDERRGNLEWTYLDVQPEAAGLPFFAGAALGVEGSDTPTEIVLESLPREGVGGLSTARSDLRGRLPQLLGARFRIASEAGGDRFRLEQVAPPLPLGTTSILLAAQPNPFHEGTWIRVFLKQAGTAQVELFDLGGRKVRTLLRDQALESGVTWLTWDGTDQHGRTSPAGVYWARAKVAGGESRLQLLRLR